jgi:glycosyltransferase involved in cell wall biosynthesis
MDISVITVSYNAASTIEQTIQSVLRQRAHADVEYIIIDGGSTDGTVECIRQHEDAIDYWVSESDEGIYDAMNKGIRRATGDWIGIINSDDWYADAAFKHHRDVVSSCPEADVVIGQLVLVSENRQYGRIVDPPTLPYHCLKSNNHPATIVRRSVYEDVGSFDLSYPLAADLDFLMRVQAHPNMTIYRCLEPFTYMRLGGASYGFRGMYESGRVEAKHRGALQGAKVWALKSMYKARRWLAHKLLPRPVFDRFRKAKWRHDAGHTRRIEASSEKNPS